MLFDSLKSGKLSELYVLLDFNSSSGLFDLSEQIPFGESDGGGVDGGWSFKTGFDSVFSFSQIFSTPFGQSGMLKQTKNYFN